MHQENRICEVILSDKSRVCLYISISISLKIVITGFVTVPQQKSPLRSVSHRINGTGSVSALAKSLFPCCGRNNGPRLRQREPSDRTADAMTNQIVLRRSSKPLQRQKMMINENSTPSSALVPPPPSRSARCAEVAGGTAAECAAVCCCCPCGVVSFIVLAVVRLPAGLCRKAIKKRGRKKKMRSLQQPKRYEDEELRKDGLELNEIPPGVSPGRWPDKSPSAVVSEMEEIWTKIYGTGFWRSPSEREH